MSLSRDRIRFGLKTEDPRSQPVDTLPQNQNVLPGAFPRLSYRHTLFNENHEHDTNGEALDDDEVEVEVPESDEEDTDRNIGGPYIRLTKEEKLRIWKPWKNTLIVKLLDHYLIIRRWCLRFRSDEALVESVATRVCLLGMPREYYDKEILARISNKIGKTIKIDRTTSSQLRGKFARLWMGVDKMCCKYGFQNYFKVKANGYSGGIWVFWNAEVIEVEVLAYSSQLTHLLLNPSKEQWLLTEIYGSPLVKERKHLWDSLKLASNDQDIPWMVIGDFNQIISPDEKHGRNSVNLTQCNQLLNCMSYCNLYDFEASGFKFTWWNKKEGLDYTQVRLDRVFVNDRWHVMFPNVVAINLPRTHSDHHPVLVRCSSPSMLPDLNKFRFKEARTSHPSFDAYLRGSFPPSLNHTLITLIPKVERLENVSQFCPISLCSVRMKLLSKILVDRLRPILTELRRNTQSSFIPRLQASDNIIVVQKAIHTMWIMKRKKGALVIKIDLEKAYDRVKWSFLQEVLIEIGLPLNWISLIMNIVQNPTFFVLWNGTPMLHGGVTKATYFDICSKVGRKLEQWSNKFLSMAGRVSLAQAVTSTMASYIMQTTLLPNNVAMEINKLNMNFIWGQVSGKRKIHAINWHTLCLPKELRGLQIKETKKFNLALLAKLGW
ncbi:Uncharacterized protein TCM_024073 [Theobroma cacao]|uniref:Reverse transcriptase domain-containing protein n=1 Tax=Theobroma cacao TaxID=3641 RepID=A0A061F2T4_THECC|nr:Uncharacterized protein TCM_024073 [Theobroma cacao]